MDKDFIKMKHSEAQSTYTTGASAVYPRAPDHWNMLLWLIALIKHDVLDSLILADDETWWGLHATFVHKRTTKVYLINWQFIVSKGWPQAFSETSVGPSFSNEVGKLAQKHESLTDSTGFNTELCDSLFWHAFGEKFLPYWSGGKTDLSQLLAT